MFQFARKLFYILVGCYALFCILFYRDFCASTISATLVNWFLYIVPVLFPGIFLITLVLALVPKKVLSKGLFLPVVLGNLMGIPCGALLLEDMCAKEIMNRKQASMLLPVCTNFGTHFLLGIVFPHTYGVDIRRILLYYGIHFSFSLIWCIFYQIVSSFTSYPANRVLIGIHKADLNSDIISIDPISAICNSISQTISKLVMIGGFMIVSSLSIVLILPFNEIYTKYSKVIVSLIEVSTGILQLNGEYPAFAVSASMLGGVSCLLQCGYIVNKQKISILPYALFKLITAFICYLVLKNP